MAEASVNFAIQTLGPLLLQEIKLLGAVRKEVESIKSELESLRSFLKDADARAAVEELEGVSDGVEESLIRTWVKQLRGEAYRIEDVIDEYTLELAKLPHGGSGLVSVLRRIPLFIKKLKLNHEVAAEIQDIKSSLAGIKRRGKGYRFRSIIDHEGSSSNEARNNVAMIPHDSLVGSYFVEDDEVVGIESTRDMLIDCLVNENGTTTHRSVVAVVGQGGLGKTTLAGKIFNNDAVKTHFLCRAWFTVGKEYNKNELLRRIIKEFYSQTGQSTPGEIYNMEEKDLITILRDQLKGKCYLIVFDDVWKIDFWGDVEHALIDSKKSSRIVITTRRKMVAEFCGPPSLLKIHELETLPPNEAWKLFCRKAFGPCSGGYCPSELEELSKDILAKCGGLPLAIVAVAGLLSTKGKAVSEWQNLLDGLGSKLGSDPHLKHCNRVLSEGYYDLPHHLKSCLLYFGMFPESCKIRCPRLKRLWIAEGFIQYSIHRSDRTYEQVAEDHLNELIERNLVQVSLRHSFGPARICQVHDLMYEIIVRKTEELGFCRVLKGENLSDCSTNTRRIMILKSFEGVSVSIKGSKVRSVILHNVDKLPDTLITVANFKLLKVLDLEDAPIDHIPKGVGNLFNLNYLSVKNTKVKIIPNSIGNLVNLEILDLKASLVIEIPVEIKSLKKLRYLGVYHYNYRENKREGAKVNEGIGSVTNLQKLYLAVADSQVLKELRNLRQLKNLGITMINGNGKDLCALIANLENLESLGIRMRGKEEILDLDSLSNPPQKLQHLFITGNMRKLPDWIFKLKNLIKIGLELSGLTDDPLIVLQSLPNLLQVALEGPYKYEHLHFEAGWFPKLRKLIIWNFKAVTKMKIEKGAMPHLRELGIACCPLLTEIPTGIEHLRNLKKIKFFGMVRQVYCMVKDKDWETVTKHVSEIGVNLLEADKHSYVPINYLSKLSPEEIQKLSQYPT